MLYAEEITAMLAGSFPHIIEATFVLLVGIFMARILAWGTAKLFHLVAIDTKLLQMLGVQGQADAEKYMDKHIFYVLLALVVLTFFAALGMPYVAALMTGFLLWGLVVLLIVLIFKLDIVGKAEGVIEKK